MCKEGRGGALLLVVLLLLLLLFLCCLDGRPHMVMVCGGERGPIVCGGQRGSVWLLHCFD